MKFVYSPQINQTIIEYEDKILKEFEVIAQGYESVFAQYNCSIKVGQWWNNYSQNMNGENRLSFEDGYVSYIYCNIEKNGEIVRYVDKDGEVDYYELSASWPISSITKRRSLISPKKACLLVSFLGDTDDMVNDLNEFLNQLIILG